jgi:hypothetical protein
MGPFCQARLSYKSRNESNERESLVDYGLSGGRGGDMRVRGDWGFDSAHADRFFGAVEKERARVATTTTRTTTTTTSRIPV